MRTRPERSRDPTAGASTFRIRLAVARDAPRLAWIRTVTWRDAYAAIMGSHALERVGKRDGERMRRAVADQRGGRRVWLVEDDEGTAFGYAWLGPQTDRALGKAGPFFGEVYELYLHPHWQRRGAGTALLVHAIWDLINAGLGPVMLWVLGENGARHFYEGVGGVCFGSRRIEFGGRTMTKFAYGWHEQLPLPR